MEPPVHPTVAPMEPAKKRSSDDGLTSDDLARLATDAPISRKSIRRVNDALEDSVELGRRLVRSISSAPLATFNALFQLSPEQREALAKAEIEDQEFLREMPRLFAGLGDSLEYIALSIGTPPSGTAMAKPKWNLKAECKGGQQGGTGGWQCGGSVGVSF